MGVKEISDELGVTVTKLAEIFGCSRQRLYQMFCEEKKSVEGVLKARYAIIGFAQSEYCRACRDPNAIYLKRIGLIAKTATLMKANEEGSEDA